MAKAKPKFINPITACDSLVEFTNGQKKILAEICNNPEFIKDLAELVSDYVSEKDLHSQMPSEAEELATLKDLRDSVCDTREKLSKLNGRSGAHLYKVDNDIEIVRESLQKIYIETVRAIEKHPKPKTGRKKNFVELYATRSLKRVFRKYDLAWNHYLHAKTENEQEAVLALKIIFSFGGKEAIEPEGIVEYIKRIDEEENKQK